MLDGSPRELRIYRTADGREPFKLWLESLRDRGARARIRTRLDRLEAGNPGQYRVLSGGVCELKIDYAAGYRVYFAESGGAVVLLFRRRH